MITSKKLINTRLHKVVKVGMLNSNELIIICMSFIKINVFIVIISVEEVVHMIEV